jgi:hypothetical protein
MSVSRAHILDTIKEVFDGRRRRTELGSLSTEELAYVAIAIIWVCGDRFLDEESILRQPLGPTLRYLVLFGTGPNGPDIYVDQLVYMSKKLGLHTSQPGRRILIKVPDDIMELVGELGFTPAIQLFLEHADAWAEFSRTGVTPEEQPMDIEVGSLEGIVAKVREKHGFTGLLALMQAVTREMGYQPLD